MFTGLNWLAILVGGVFNWLFGWLWFGPLLGGVFRRIVPGAGSVGGLNLASFIGLGLSLLVAAGLAFVLKRTGVKTLAGAALTTLVVCVAFNTTVYVAYMSANERPQLQAFIAIYDLVSYVLTGVLVQWLSQRRRTA
jgi:hypothetical protein